MHSEEKGQFEVNPPKRSHCTECTVLLVHSEKNLDAMLY